LEASRWRSDANRSFSESTIGKCSENAKGYFDKKQTEAVVGSGEEGRSGAEAEIGEGEGNEEERLIARLRSRSAK